MALLISMLSENERLVSIEMGQDVVASVLLEKSHEDTHVALHWRSQQEMDVVVHDAVCMENRTIVTAIRDKTAH